MVLVRRGVAAYRAKRFLEAGRSFQQAYALSHVANQLRNAARAFEEGQDLSTARALWSEYREHASLTAAEKAEAEARIALIDERAKQAEVRGPERGVAGATTPDFAAPPPDSSALTGGVEGGLRGASDGAMEGAADRTATSSVSTSLRSPVPSFTVVEADAARSRPGGSAFDSSPEEASYLPPGLTLGAGGVLAIVAGALWGHASARLGRLDDRLSARDGDDLVIGLTRDDAVAELRGINRERRVSMVVGGLAIGAVVGGVVWWLSRP